MTNEHQRTAVRLIDGWTTPHTAVLADAGLVSPIADVVAALEAEHREQLALACAVLRNRLRVLTDPLVLDIGSRCLAEAEHAARTL